MYSDIFQIIFPIRYGTTTTTTTTIPRISVVTRMTMTNVTYSALHQQQPGGGGAALNEAVRSAAQSHTASLITQVWGTVTKGGKGGGRPRRLLEANFVRPLVAKTAGDGKGLVQEDTTVDKPLASRNHANEFSKKFSEKQSSSYLERPPITRVSSGVHSDNQESVSHDTRHSRRLLGDESGHSVRLLREGDETSVRLLRDADASNTGHIFNPVSVLFPDGRTHTVPNNHVLFPDGTVVDEPLQTPDDVHVVLRSPDL